MLNGFSAKADLSSIIDSTHTLMHLRAWSNKYVRVCGGWQDQAVANLPDVVDGDNLGT